MNKNNAICRIVIASPPSVLLDKTSISSSNLIALPKGGKDAASIRRQTLQ